MESPAELNCKGWFTSRRIALRCVPCALYASSRCQFTGLRATNKNFDLRLALLFIAMTEDSDVKELFLLILLHRRQRKRRKQGRDVWIRGIFTQRRQQGEFHNLVQEMRLSDSQSHFRYFRMSKETFDDLLSLVRTDKCVVCFPQTVL